MTRFEIKSTKNADSLALSKLNLEEEKYCFP